MGGAARRRSDRAPRDCCRQPRSREPPLPSSKSSVLLCDDAVIAALNARWRGRDEPTNVLSFPAARRAADAGRTGPLGDIAIACETVTREAQTRSSR